MALALFLSKGERLKAHELAEESLTLFRAVGNRRFIGYVLILLGEILLVEREGERAQSMFEESLAIFKGIGERFGTALALISIARMLAYKGGHEAALAYYKESWDLLGANGDRELIAACLEGYGEVLVALGEAKWAVRLWGIAATTRAEIVAPMPPIYRSDYVQAVASAREILDEEAFQLAWTKGSQTSLEQVLLTP